MSDQKIIDDLIKTAETGDPELLIKVLKDIRPGTVPVDILTGLPSHMSATLPNAQIIMPYSGILDPANPVDGLKAWQFATTFGEGSGGAVGVINQTDAAKFLSSDSFTQHLKASSLAEGKSFDQILNGVDAAGNRVSINSLWDITSERFMIDNAIKPKVSLTPFADPKAVYGATELPAYLNPKTASSTFEALPREAYLGLMDQGGDINNVMRSISTQSYLNVSQIEYAFDDKGRVLLGTENFWNNQFPDIPRMHIPDNITMRHNMSDIVLNVDPKQANNLLAGADDIAKMAPHSDEAAKLAGAIADSKGLQLLAKGGKAGIVITGLVTAASLALTKDAIASQHELADIYTQKDMLSPVQAEAFHAMLDEMEPRMLLAAGDPFVATSLGQAAILEKDLHSEYAAFVNANPGLDPEVVKSLTPGLVPVASLRDQISGIAYDFLEGDLSQMPPELQGLVVANENINQASENYITTYSENFIPMPSMGGAFVDVTSYLPSVRKAEEALEKSRAAFETEVSNVLARPEGRKALVSVMDGQQLAGLVEITAPFNQADMDPLVEELVKTGAAKDDTWFGWTGLNREAKEYGAALSSLEARPEVMRDYLQDLFTPQDQQALAMEAGMGRDAMSNLSLEQAVAIERLTEYNQLAIPLANMRDSMPLDPLEEEGLKKILDNPEKYQDIIAAADERFPAQMVEIRHERELEQQRLMEEELRMKEAARLLAEQQAQEQKNPDNNNLESDINMPDFLPKSPMLGARQ